MADPMRIRATEANGEIEVKVLMKHNMETGQRKDAEGKLIPEHYITDLVAKNNDKIVFQAHFGPSISKDPYLSFKYKGGAKGDKVSVSWTDSKGENRSDETTVK